MVKKPVFPVVCCPIWCPHANCSLIFLVLADSRGTRGGRLLLQPSASRFYVVCDQSWASAPLSSRKSLSPLTSGMNKTFLSENCHSLDIFSFRPFSVNPRDENPRKKKNTQTRPSSTNNHAMLKIALPLSVLSVNSEHGPSCCQEMNYLH